MKTRTLHAIVEVRNGSTTIVKVTVPADMDSDEVLLKLVDKYESEWGFDPETDSISIIHDNDFESVNLCEQGTDDSATEPSAVEFLKWCNTPVHRSYGDLGFKLRVNPQFPDYDTYLILDESGRSVLPRGEYISTEEVYAYWLETRNGLKV
ncbi:hypothetical protein E6Q11_05095 [Candidatus Dojkabacteria bacterium]|uniref:Uncharacterized protein n=1 Tax=Candidatus Dojkabacteria bacterium TaxID=2099670 RepID=A0A5C7J4G2_9BACT|nr:MAG: hypothetical protein E6Q11_05095 [Candidatus Dojkabacteria bacterium]